MTVRVGEDALADQVASLAHAAQSDKAGSPYIHHPRRVARAVTGILAKSVALLHDTIEDTAVTEEMLRVFGFSEETVEAVKIVSRKPGETYRDFIRRIKESNNEAAIAVKVADLRDNLRPGCPSNLEERYREALRILAPDTPAAPATASPELS